MLAPGFKELGDYLQKMQKELEVNSEEFDFLGYQSCIGLDSSRSNSLISHYYFRNYEGLHKFAHSGIHRVGWDWWNKTIKEHPHLGM
jgi:hypothetical protein